MKLNTRVWIRMQSKGRPKFTVTKQVVIRDAVLEIARWLTDVYMGSRLEISIARTEEELEAKTPALDNDIVAELESLLGGTPEEEELSLACLHGESPNDCGICKIEESL